MVVTASTLATDSRLISRSTRYRSSLTRSRISRAVRACPILLVSPMEFFSLAGRTAEPSAQNHLSWWHFLAVAARNWQQQAAEVLAGNAAHIFQRFTPQLSQLP